MAAPPKPWERKQTEISSQPAEAIITPSQSIPVPLEALPPQTQGANLNFNSSGGLGDIAAASGTDGTTTSSLNRTTGLGNSYGSSGMGGYGMGGMGGMGGMYGGMGGMGMGGMYGRGMGGMYGGMGGMYGQNG